MGGDSDDLLITDDNVFGTASDDAFRRDFTINALFYDVHTREIVDFVDGLADIEARTVRSIGDPDVRLREDPVRMLRAIKFASRLDLQIEEGLWGAIVRHRREIAKAAPPRLMEEIYRLFRPGVSIAAFRLLREAGLWQLLLPLVATHLDEGGDTALAEYEAMLEAVDLVWKLRNATATDAQILMALLWTPWKATLAEAQAQAKAEGRRPDIGATVQEFLTPWMTGLRVPRKIQDRIRQVWMAQSRFEPGGRRRRKTDAFLRRRFFEDAVDFFEIRTRATGGDLSLVDTWRARGELKPLPDAHRRKGAKARSDQEGPPTPSSGEEEDAAPKKRRRRRRRRRRGGGGGAAAGSGEGS